MKTKVLFLLLLGAQFILIQNNNLVSGISQKAPSADTILHFPMKNQRNPQSI